MRKSKEVPVEQEQAPAQTPASPEEQLVALLGQLNDEKLAERIAQNSQKIAELVAPLKHENAILQRCRMILRGKRMAAGEGLRTKGGGKRGAATTKGPSVASSEASLRDRVLARLSFGPGLLRNIAEECEGNVEDVREILCDLERAGKAVERPTGSWSPVRETPDH